MSLETIIEISFVAIFTGGLGTLIWARMNRLEGQVIDVQKALGAMATREDLGQFRSEIGQFRTEMGQFRTEMGQFRTEMREDMSALRQELAVMRSDLTHVALAVGVNRPRPAEG